jgi:hypothetical protein
MANPKVMGNVRSMTCALAALTLAATLLQAVAGPIAPASASVRPRHRLAGVTKIVGDGSAWMRVRLTKDIDPHAQDPDRPAGRLPAQITGDGRVVAAVLTRGVASGEIGSGPSIYLWSLGRCAERACATSGFRTTWLFSQNLAEAADGRRVLPAGNYRLYLVADGAPARVRIDFPELSGRRKLSPSRPVRDELHTVEPLSAEDEEGNVYYGGAHAPFDGPGFALGGLWLDGEGSDTQAGSCVYETRMPPPGDAAFAPPCPTADVSTISFASGDYNEVGYVGLGVLPLAMGLWRKAADTTRNAGGLTLWLSF